MHVAVRRPLHPEPAEPVLPLLHHHPVAEDLEVLDEDVLAVGEEGRPVGALGGRHRRRPDREVPGVLVGDDEEAVALVVERHLDAGPPRDDEPRRRLGMVRVHHPHLARGEAAAGEDHEGAALGPLDAQVEEDVGLVVDLDVRRAAGADPVPPDPVGPLGGVGGGVEDGGAVAGPGQPEAERADPLRQPGAGVEVADPELEVLVPVRVHEHRQAPVVGAHLQPAELEVLLPLRLRVLVEDHLLGGVEAPALARVDGIGLPFLRARVVEVVVPPHRHAEVGLLDPAEHLAVEPLAEGGGVRGHRVGVGVLRLEVADDLGILAVPEPGPRVLAALAVELGHLRAARRHRRRRDLGRKGSGH